MLKLHLCSADRLLPIARRGYRNRMANENAVDVIVVTTRHLRIYICTQIKEQNKTTNVIVDIKYLDSQIRQKNDTFPLIIDMLVRFKNYEVAVEPIGHNWISVN